MSKRSSEVQKAIQNLQMSQPYHLRKQTQVALRPPQIEGAQNEGPQIQAPQMEGPQNELPQSEAALIEVPHNKAPQIEVPPTGEPKVEGPQVEPPRLSGFFKLSHAVFGDSAIRKLSGDSFRLFLWMSALAWRFPDSDGTVRASLTYIELGTGVSLATISRSLKQLKEEGLVTLIEKDFKHGNVWRVSRVASHDPEDPKPKTQDTQSEPPKTELPQIGKPAPSNREGTSITLRELVPQNEGQPRTSKNSQETKNSLSVIGSEKLREYFASLAPRSKREREIRAFQELREEYSEERITQALEQLLNGGALGLKEPCHSPMAFLRHAIEQVLREVDSEESRQQESLKRQAIEAAQSKAREDQERAEQDVIKSKIEAFEAAFPDPGERQEKIRELTPGLPYIPELSLRAMAAERWSQRICASKVAASG